MPKDNILLSIIIPTKNRYVTLLPVVTAILEHVTADDIEVVVQDNSDDNQPATTFLQEFTDKRLKYAYQKEHLSITDNTINAIANATGKYFIFIGDDDLVSPYVYEITKMIDAKSIDCLIYNPAYYWWSSVDFVKETNFHRKNAFWMPDNISLELVPKSAKTELDFVISNGAVSYFDLPRMYHGIVKKEVIERIKEKTGTYLPGSCPDIAIAASIALVLEDFHFMNYPVSVFGASKNSGAGWTAGNTHFGKLEDIKFLPKNIGEIWDPLVPRIWSAHTFYAQTVQEVLKAFKVPRHINFETFYGSMLAYENNLKKYLYPVMKAYCKNNPGKYLRIYLTYFKKKAGIIYRKIRFNSNNIGYTVFLAENVDSCMKLMGKENNIFNTKINAEKTS